MFNWPVVPLCKAQLKDINQDDVLEKGLYRKCNTYKSGGGYDEFPNIYRSRFYNQIPTDLNTHSQIDISTQFIIQLLGCPLSCPYCYVTKDGVFGKYVLQNTVDILSAFNRSKCDVLHLMGGAPALYLKEWKHIAKKVPLFHSDFLLVESLYNEEYLNGLPGLHAVSIKDSSIYTAAQLTMIIPNLMTLIKCNVSFYITFTGGDDRIERFIKKTFGKSILKDSFRIQIQNYKALEGN